MKNYFKTAALIFFVIIANYCATIAQVKNPPNPSGEKLSEKQSIGYQLKHGLLKRNTTPQSTNIDKGKHTQTEIKENDSYFNDRVYIKFKTHNLSLTTLNPDNSKLYAKSFSDANMDELAIKYNFDKIEQAFKINPKKYKAYLEKPHVNEEGKRNLNNIFVVYFSKPIDILRFITEFSKFENIEYVEPVPKEKYFATPNDSYYSSQFYFEHIQAEAAWDIHKGEDGDSTIIIGICDSGVEWMHSDLIDNLYQNLGEDADDDGHTIEFIAGEWVLDPGDLNNTDDDYNGYTDDLIGWNFYPDDGTDKNNPNGSTSNPHGTHVAGISAGVTNNSNGISSISWNVKFLPTKNADNAEGLTVYNGFDGIVYLAEFGADVINCSWGGDKPSTAIQELIDYATGLGSIIVAAAGNSGIDTASYPGSYHGIISVASIAENHSKAYYSTYSAAVDISAYGGDYSVDNGILSSVPGNDYANFQGTSMATPLVAGLIGLIKSYQPTYGNSKIIEILLANADNIDAENSSYINKLGYGKINAYKSLKNLDATLSKALKVNVLQQDLISKCALISAGDTVKILYKFSNSNPFYGSETVFYRLASSDTNVIIMSGSKEVDVNPDSDFTLNSLWFRINPNAQIQNTNVALIFTNAEGFDSDSIFYTNFSINELSGARAYVAWGHDIDPLAPVKFPLDSASNLTYLTDDMSPMYVTASTWANGKWYCVEDDYDLITFDTTSGARTYIGNLGKQINGLAFDAQTNMIWGVGNADGDTNFDDLFVINPNDATLKLMASPNDGLNYANLACDSSGQLYSIDIANDLLVSIDKWTGNAYTVFELQDDFMYAQDMDYDAKNDKIIAATYNSSGESSIAYVDLVNFKLRKISDVQNNDEITGLVFPHDNSSPYAFDLVSPEFASTMENNLAFKWEKFTGATQYYVYISNYSNMNNYNVFSTTDTSIVLDPHAIPYGPVYWKVAAVDADGHYHWSWRWMVEYKGQYCSALNYNCDEHISKFELGDFSNSSDCGLMTGYSDYTNKAIDVYNDLEYNIKITNPVAYLADSSAVWIDFNANNNFDQDEMILLVTNDGGSTFQGSVFIPAEADTGLFRLRARILYSTMLEPCGYVKWGETEDYTMHIKGVYPYPTLSTNSVTGITSNSAVSGGNITNDGGANVTARGVCWSTTKNPTTENSKTTDGSGTGSFTSSITSLTPNTKYYVRAYGTNSSGTGYGNQDSLITEFETHTILLDKGWNMISTYIVPENDSIKVVLKPIADSLVIAKNSAGLMYLPSKSIDLIKIWNTRQGYMLYMKNNDTLDIIGTPLPKDSLLYLAKGWNMIAYTRKTEQAIATALAGIVSNMVIAKNSAGLMYLPSKNINLIGNMKPGAGYMIYMTSADTLDYPEGSGKRTVDEFCKLPSHLIAKTSPYNMNVIIETDLPDEYEIGAYNTNGKLVGSGIVENGKAAVTIFADDENTDEIDGARASEPVKFKAYNTKNDLYETFDCAEIQDIVSEKMLTAVNYSTNVVLSAKATTEIKTGEDYYVNIYPNPTKNKIELQINFSSATEADVKVYNLQGNELISVFVGNLPQGESKLQINCESLSNGTYNVVIQMKDKSITKRFVVAR